MTKKWLPLLWFVLCLAAAGCLAALSPRELSLGPAVRIVLLHAAFVLTAEATLAAAALTGLLGLVFRRSGFHRWSSALGRSGVLFWVVSLPLSLLAMNASWNGLFLAEPRFRLAFAFAVAGILLQLSLVLFSRSWLTSLVNLLFFITLIVSLTRAAYVMHPLPSPILGSAVTPLQGFYAAILLLTLLASYFLTRTWLSK
jgi:hypothetical protein